MGSRNYEPARADWPKTFSRRIPDRPDIAFAPGDDRRRGTNRVPCALPARPSGLAVAVVPAGNRLSIAFAARGAVRFGWPDVPGGMP
jgi:hypothetical protein